MQLLSYSFERRKFFLKEGTLPEPKEGEVLVRISNSAVCGTDKHILDGIAKRKAYSKKELLLGHVWSGYVEKLGKKVDSFKLGEAVTGFSYLSCGKCKRCKDGSENICESYQILGMEMPGTHGELAVFPERMLYKLPPGMDMEEGALLIDLFGTAYHALKRINIFPRKRIAIFGAGPMGIALALILKVKFGARDISIAEPSAYRRKLAASILKQKIIKNIPADYFDVAIEATGEKKAFEAAFSCLKRKGTLLALGVQDENIEIPAIKLVSREISIVGTLTSTRKEIDELALFFKTLKPHKLITHKLPLVLGAKGYELMNRRKAGIVILKTTP